MNNRIKPSIFEVNILYLLLGIGLLLIGSTVQSIDIYSGLLVTEYILILLPSLLFIQVKGYSFKKVLRLNKIKVKQILMVIIITIFTYPLAVFLQAILIGILSTFREITPTGVPMPQDGLQYIMSFFIIAISPGICEEVMFRGVILNAYEELGHRKAIIITALLFGIFHFTLLNIVGPFAIGIVFGIMVYKTNSIYSSIIGHTVNNGIALTLGYFINKYQYLLDEAMVDEIETTSLSAEIVAGLGIMIILGISLTIVITLLKKLSHEKIEKETRIWDHLESSEDDIQRIEPNGTLKKLQYIPVYVVVLIFIFINWKYVLL